MIKCGKVVIDDNEITRWCFSNVSLKLDYNENVKPIKTEKQQKIDIGVFIAWKLVTGLPMFWLINLICIVLLWTSYTLLSAAKKDKAKGIA